MPTFPSASFPHLVTFPGQPDAPESLTNAQKLALAGNTAVGTRVQVTDGFVVANDPQRDDGFYFANGVANGRPSYSTLNSADGDIRWDPFDSVAWVNDIGSFTNDDVAFPWLGADNGLGHTGYTMTHPAVQQLAISDPSDETHWSVVA